MLLIVSVSYPTEVPLPVVKQLEVEFTDIQVNSDIFPKWKLEGFEDCTLNIYKNLMRFECPWLPWRLSQTAHHRGKFPSVPLQDKIPLFSTPSRWKYRSQVERVTITVIYPAGWNACHGTVLRGESKNEDKHVHFSSLASSQAWLAVLLVLWAPVNYAMEWI